MLGVRGLTVRFEDTVAVDAVDLEVPTGTVTAVLGPSGCGKSTLLRTIAGLEAPARGSVTWEGRPVDGVPTHRRGFALMFQDGQLFPHQSVARNVGYPLRLRRTPRRETADRVGELLELVGLGGYGARAPATLSGGERQRVALARALAVRPRLLLLDEPLSALDAALRADLAGELRRILAEAGTTAVMVTHDQEEAFAVADRMAVMRHGRLVQSGTLTEVWQHPADAWTASFLGYATVLDRDAAERVRTAAGLGPGPWPAVALRRSALRVHEGGPLRGTVLSSRRAPELLRLEIDLAEVGRAAAVAAPDAHVAVGDEVDLRLDPRRLAVIGPVTP